MCGICILCLSSSWFGRASIVSTAWNTRGRGVEVKRVASLLLPGAQEVLYRIPPTPDLLESTTIAHTITTQRSSVPRTSSYTLRERRAPLSITTLARAIFAAHRNGATRNSLQPEYTSSPVTWAHARVWSVGRAQGTPRHHTPPSPTTRIKHAMAMMMFLPGFSVRPPR